MRHHFSTLLFIACVTIFSSCSVEPLDTDLSRYAPDHNLPQKQTETAKPTKVVQEKTDVNFNPTIPKEVVVREQVSAAHNIANEPKRKFAFRTPDLVNTLPSDRELNKEPQFQKAIDEKVEEGTTIRATQ